MSGKRRGHRIGNVRGHQGGDAAAFLLYRDLCFLCTRAWAWHAHPRTVDTQRSNGHDCGCCRHFWSAELLPFQQSLRHAQTRCSVFLSLHCPRILWSMCCVVCGQRAEVHHPQGSSHSQLAHAESGWMILDSLWYGAEVVGSWQVPHGRHN